MHSGAAVNPRRNKMQFIISKTTTETYAVEADDPKTAAEMDKKGESKQMTYNETMSVQPRPAQPVRPNPMQSGILPTGVLPRPPM